MSRQANTEGTLTTEVTVIQDQSSVPAPPTDERPCACQDGQVYIGHVVEDPETGGEVEEVVSVRCGRCERKVEHGG